MRRRFSNKLPNRTSQSVLLPYPYHLLSIPVLLQMWERCEKCGKCPNTEFNHLLRCKFVWRSRRAGEPRLLTGIPQNNIYKEPQGKLKPLTANPWKETSQELYAETNFQTASIQLSWGKYHVWRSTERRSCGSKEVVKWSIWWVCGMGFRVPHVLNPQR